MKHSMMFLTVMSNITNYKQGQEKYGENRHDFPSDTAEFSSMSDNRGKEGEGHKQRQQTLIMDENAQKVYGTILP